LLQHPTLSSAFADEIQTGRKSADAVVWLLEKIVARIPDVDGGEVALVSGEG
jgi:hypothetical protein